MSSVKEECEDISVMEATGLKTEDQQMDKEDFLQEDIKEEHELEVKPLQEDSSSQECLENSEPGISFSDSSHPRIHTGEELFTCSQCGESFSYERSLKRHLDVHEGKRPHQCSQCEWSFKSVSHLREHKKTHMVEKPFACSQCGCSFKRLPDLRRHERTHLGDTGEKPFSCSQCGKSYP
ncbi:zinc finger protein 135-like, partial [Colossoma macropomum]|uniref:zinc finger protein 135-like n=1 Tax=Colossoma macropomum TaxID=42526 RepID=UPI001863C20B